MLTKKPNFYLYTRVFCSIFHVTGQVRPGFGIGRAGSGNRVWISPPSVFVLLEFVTASDAGLYEFSRPGAAPSSQFTNLVVYGNIHSQRLMTSQGYYA